MENETPPEIEQKVNPPKTEIPSPAERKEQEKSKGHELVTVFEEAGYPLNWMLKDMLNEPKEAQGGRKGSGFTQATRHLAEFVRRPRSSQDVDIFDYKVKSDIQDKLMDEVEEYWNVDLRSKLDKEKLAQIPGKLTREESKLIANMILDILEVPRERDESIMIPPATEHLKVGTCTTAEVYFLEYVYDPDFWVGRQNFGQYFNIITDKVNNPVLLEKVGVGERSALSLAPITINGIETPPGSLLSLEYSQVTASPLPWGGLENFIGGYTFSVDKISGAEYLRLTTLAVPPEIRERAFGAHHRFNAENQIRGYGVGKIQDYIDKTKRALSNVY